MSFSFLNLDKSVLTISEDDTEGDSDKETLVSIRKTFNSLKNLKELESPSTSFEQNKHI